MESLYPPTDIYFPRNTLAGHALNAHNSSYSPHSLQPNNQFLHAITTTPRRVPVSYNLINPLRIVFITGNHRGPSGLPLDPSFLSSGLILVKRFQSIMGSLDRHMSGEKEFCLISQGLDPS